MRQAALFPRCSVSRQPSIKKRALVVWRPSPEKPKRLRGREGRARNTVPQCEDKGSRWGEAGGGGGCQVCTVLLSFFPSQPVTLFSVAWSRVQAAAPQRDIQSGTQRGSRQRGPNDEETRFVAGSNTNLPPERRRLRRVSQWQRRKALECQPSCGSSVCSVACVQVCRCCVVAPMKLHLFSSQT